MHTEAQTQSPQTFPEKRSVTAAFLLGLLAPGLGFLYAGKWRLALLSPIALLAVLAFVS